MIILEQYIDMAGKIRAICQLSNGETINLKFQTQPTQLELDTIEDRYIEQHQYDDLQQESISIYDHVDLIIEFITKIKSTPTITLTQYNTWLGTKQWWETAIIRYFVYQLAIQLAQKYDLVLANYTETTVLGKLRDWIVATPIGQISKIVLNES